MIRSLLAFGAFATATAEVMYIQQPGFYGVSSTDSDYASVDMTLSDCPPGMAQPANEQQCKQAADYAVSGYNQNWMGGLAAGYWATDFVVGDLSYNDPAYISGCIYIGDTTNVAHFHFNTAPAGHSGSLGYRTCIPYVPPPVDPCQANLAARACHNFADTADFNIVNNDQTSTQIDMTYKTVINGAYSYIGQGPWVETAPNTPLTGAGAFPQQPAGLVFTNQGSTLASATCVPTAAAAAFPFGCPATVGSGAETACNDNTIVMTGTITDMVSQLDTNGDYTLYFQRVDVNPITGPGLTLMWIAENACKLKVEVTFECSGSECVEVTTIVCATFAGITTASFGQVSTECKVPSSFAVSTTSGGGSGLGSATVRHSDNVYTNPSAPTGGSFGDTGGCTSGTGRCYWLHTSNAAIGSGSGATFVGASLVGGISYTAFVRGPSVNGNPRWSATEELLHQAKYNLTVASALAKTFDMDVNVNFHSAPEDSGAVKTSIADIKTLAGFNAATASGPFLARSKVEMGAIVNHQHAYLQVVAKVAAGSSWFKDLKISKVVHNAAASTATSSDAVITTDSTIAMVTTTPAAGECRIASSPASAGSAATEAQTNAATTGAPTHWHMSSNDAWPMAYIYCESFMSQGFTDDTTTTAGPPVTAGDTLVISLTWKLAKTSSSSGKAQLLQEADAPGQNVEVSLTIQLGGGETTITTAGAGADGSADNTVTYIIIAVCVIAAALILAVVVVAFMCLRNRSQEQLVAMSPNKATVAAVYDISQPKAKAEVMDV